MQPLSVRVALAMARQPGLRQVDIARACGVSTASVADWLNGKTASLKPKSARLAADLFKCSQAWIGEGIGTPNWSETHPASAGPAVTGMAHPASQADAETGAIESIKVPVIGTLAPGPDPMFELRASPDGRPIGHVPAYSGARQAYAVRVFGDELYPAVRHGACLVVQPGAPCQAGELMLLETAEGYFLVCELVSQADDAVTFVPAKGGQRRTTLPRAGVVAMHPVLDVVSASRFEPAA